MRFQLRKCKKCNTYTMKENCSVCKEKTSSVHPAKCSPDDKYLRFRIAQKNN